MKNRITKLGTVAAMAAGMMFAQGQTPSPAPNAPAARQNFVRRHLARIAQQLNLTDTQKQQAKSIFHNAREAAKPIREQLKQNREALMAAAKAGQSDSQIQQLAAKQGELVGKMTAIRTEAFSKFYKNVLTSEQRAKADQMQQQFREREHNRVRQHANG